MKRTENIKHEVTFINRHMQKRAVAIVETLMRHSFPLKGQEVVLRQRTCSLPNQLQTLAENNLFQTF